MAKKKEVSAPIPEPKKTIDKPNVFNKEIEVSQEQVMELQKQGLLVGYYEKEGKKIALIR